MRKDGKAEVQHYVPQVLLRLHAEDPSAKRESRQIWCFDKQTDKVFQSNVKGVMASSRFYEVDIDGLTMSLEEPLSELESVVSPVLVQLVRDQNLSFLTEENRLTISSFCAVQMLRTQGFRDQIKDMNEGFAEALRRRGHDPSKVSNFKLLSDDEIKEFSMRMLADAPQTYAPHFFGKFWHLIGTTPNDPFHVGDHPVVIDSDLPGARRAVGLASPGVTVYLPLSPTLCLGMSDPALVKELFEGAGTVRKNLKREIEATDPRDQEFNLLNEKLNGLNHLIEPMETGAPNAYNPQTVMRVNSLQMLHAGRWIISSKPDFSLPRQMLADDPDLRSRLRVVVE